MVLLSNGAMAAAASSSSGGVSGHTERAAPQEEGSSPVMSSPSTALPAVNSRPSMSGTHSQHLNTEAMLQARTRRGYA
jgi:hypothetical protein